MTLRDAPVVHLVAERGDVRRFCCVGCAETWTEVTARSPARAVVQDSRTGEPLAAREAWFARSRVVAQPATGDRVHVFASREEADRHCRVYGGTVLEGPDRPLGGVAQSVE